MRQSDSRLRSPASPGSFIPLRRRFVLFLFAFFGAGREFPPLSKNRRCVVPRTSYVATYLASKTPFPTSISLCSLLSRRRENEN
jgi:hypothetical protein